MNVRSLGYGRVGFVAGIEATPETVETKNEGGNEVRVVLMAEPGRAARYDVRFFISCAHEAAGRKVHNSFHWDTSVPAEDRSSPYADIELAAARTLPDALRAIADALQSEIEAATARDAEKAT